MSAFTALGAPGRRVSAEYFVPYYAHAPMEVPNAVAHFVNGKCEIWTPTQFPGLSAAASSAFSGHAPPLDDQGSRPIARLTRHSE
jgi:CO/xanthine dehydrogenase Mo-binding subunit